jgi:hypothetical protein
MFESFKLNKAFDELQAIDDVRLELAKGVKNGMTETEIAEIHARLMSLYAALDITNIVSIIHKIDFKEAA